MVEGEIKNGMGIFDLFSVWQALGDRSLYAYCLLYPPLLLLLWLPLQSCILVMALVVVPSWLYVPWSPFWLKPLPSVNFPCTLRLRDVCDPLWSQVFLW